MKTESGQDPRIAMKKRLAGWGAASELCMKKHNEIQKIQRLIREAEGISSGGITGMPKSGNVADPTYRAAELIIDEYEAEMGRAAADIKRILSEKNAMDRLIRLLDSDGERVLYYRFVKKYRPERISMEISLSRAQAYRILNRTIDRLIFLENCILQKDETK